MNFINDLKQIKISTFSSFTQKQESYQTQKVKEVLKKYDIGEKDSHCDVYFVHHPNGSQKFPDFHIINRFSGFTVSLELKSSKTNTIFWNDGFPIYEDTIYLFSNKKFSVVFTKDFLSPFDSRQYEFARKIVDTINNTSSLINDSFNFKFRKCITQKVDKNIEKPCLAIAISNMDKIFSQKENLEQREQREKQEREYQDFIQTLESIRIEGDD